MSFYAKISGNITYPSLERFNETVKMLNQDGCMVNTVKMNQDGKMVINKFIDECGDFVSGEEGGDFLSNGEPDVHEQTLTIVIPFGLYRNLARRLTKMTKDTKGTVVWSSTDGCFEGGVYENGVEECYDLKKWAEENLEEENKTPPNIETDFDVYCEWQSMVEQELHNL